MVEPDALLIVEACSRLAAFRDVELLHEFLQREQLLLCAWVPSKQGKEVYYCLRGVLSTVMPCFRASPLLGLICAS